MAKGKKYNDKGYLIEVDHEFNKEQKAMNIAACIKYDKLRAEGYTNSKALGFLKMDEKRRVQCRNHKNKKG